MSSGVNKAIILGRLGQDPKSRSMTSGDLAASFSVATSDRWTDNQGARKEKTVWHSIVCYGKLAEIATQYLKKGSQVYIEGKIDNREWTDKNGVQRISAEIKANRIEMLGGGNNAQQDGFRPDNYDGRADYSRDQVNHQQAKQNGYQEQKPRVGPPASAHPPQMDQSFPPDDDVPF